MQRCYEGNLNKDCLVGPIFFDRMEGTVIEAFSASRGKPFEKRLQLPHQLHFNKIKPGSIVDSGGKIGDNR